MSFGEFLLYLVAVFAWVGLISIWLFVMMDTFRRRDLPGWGKAVWLLVVLFLPVIGTCIYLIARPRTDAWYTSDRVEWYTSDRVEAMAAERADTQPWVYRDTASSAEQLRVLAD